jgi:hypothetical protein
MSIVPLLGLLILYILPHRGDRTLKQNEANKPLVASGDNALL